MSSTATAEPAVKFKKVVRIGKGDWGHVYCKIEITSKGDKRPRLSISGVEGPMRNGDAKGSCGQIVDSVSDVKEFAPGWTPILAGQFMAVWRTWHLNDMQAGCQHQRAEEWDKRPLDPSKPTSAYVKHPDGGSGWNMLVWVPVKHGGLLSAPCPVCGYKYGSSWLYEPLPQDVIDFLKALPDTDLTPAWV